MPSPRRRSLSSCPSAPQSRRRPPPPPPPPRPRGASEHTQTLALVRRAALAPLAPDRFDAVARHAERRSRPRAAAAVVQEARDQRRRRGGGGRGGGAVSGLTAASDGGAGQQMRRVGDEFVPCGGGGGAVAAAPRRGDPGGGAAAAAAWWRRRRAARQAERAEDSAPRSAAEATRTAMWLARIGINGGGAPWRPRPPLRTAMGARRSAAAVRSAGGSSVASTIVSWMRWRRASGWSAVTAPSARSDAAPPDVTASISRRPRPRRLLRRRHRPSRALAAAAAPVAAAGEPRRGVRTALPSPPARGE